MISIIVPVYNVEEYLPKCIQSIQEQTHQDIEIILVDDGSTDRSGIICDMAARSDARIKVVHKENGGPTAARKAGLQLVHGEYVGFVDGDDYIDMEMFGRLLQVMEQEKADFVHSGWKKNDGADIYGVSCSGSFRLDQKTAVELIVASIFDCTGSRSISPSNWSKLYKRKLISAAYQEVPDEIDFGEDLLCLCLCLLKAGSYASIKEAHYHYVMRESSITNSKGALRLGRVHRMHVCMKEIFRRYGIYAELSEALECFYMRNLLYGIRSASNIICPIYQYPSIQDFFGKRTILYGAGEVGQDYYVQFRRDMRCEVVAVADMYPEHHLFDYMKVVGADEILGLEYDVIVISVLYEGIAESIKRSLLEKGIPEEKVAWKRPTLAI